MRRPGPTLRAVPATMLLGLALLLGLVVPTLLPVGSADAAPAEQKDPLTVRIGAVAPAVVPRHGPLVVRGTVRNDSTQTWSDVRAYPLTSSQPFTTALDLAEAAATDPDSDVGTRLLTVGQRLGDLAPGTSTTFRIRIPRRVLEISGAPGVYWLGVQVLGADTAGRDQLADGRARTFLPLVGRHQRARLALVVPLRAATPRAADGSLADAGALARSMAPTGRLGRLVAWGGRAGSITFSWLVDPALLDAAADIGAGDPDLGVARATTQTTAPASPSAGSSPSGSADAPRPALTDQDQRNAQAWRSAATQALQAQPTLALPYGDPDVSLLADHDPGLLGDARTLQRATFADLKLTGTPVVAPVDGRIDPAALRRLGAGTTVLLGSGAGMPPAGASRLAAGRQVVVADPVPPTSTDADSPLDLRQQLLAAAALRAVAGDRRPVVAVLPTDWDPGTAAAGSAADGFLSGLDQPWLQTGPLPAPRAHGPTRLGWPAAARAAQVPLRNLDVARQLLRRGTVLDELVDDEDTRLHRVLLAAALGTVGYPTRTDPVTARIRADGLAARIDQLRAEIKVLGTDFVTLSGGSGVLTVAVVNGLDEPVTVGLRAITDNPRVHLDLPRPVHLAEGQRSTLRVHARSDVIGVHQVRLVPITTEGSRISTPLYFNLRTSQAGRVFWAVLGACAVGLVLLVVRRIRIRVRERGTRP